MVSSSLLSDLKALQTQIRNTPQEKRRFLQGPTNKNDSRLPTLGELIYGGNKPVGLSAKRPNTINSGSASVVSRPIPPAPNMKTPTMLYSARPVVNNMPPSFMSHDDEPSYDPMDGGPIDMATDVAKPAANGCDKGGCQPDSSKLSTEDIVGLVTTLIGKLDKQ
jgi:hypothetical protein